MSLAGKFSEETSLVEISLEIKLSAGKLLEETSLVSDDVSS